VDAGWDGEDYLRSGMRGAFWDCKILYKIPNNKDRLGTAIQAPDSKRRILVQKTIQTFIDRSSGTDRLLGIVHQAGELPFIFSLYLIVPTTFTPSFNPFNALATSCTPSTPPSKPRLPRRRLRPALQVRVRVANRPGDSVEGETRGFGRELHFGADVEEGEIPVDEVVRDAGCFVLRGRKDVAFSKEQYGGCATVK
jgi:hypothetical protein